MIKNRFVFTAALSVFFYFNYSSQTPGGMNGTDIIRTMHKKYFHGPCKSYTFSQKNTHYRNDTVTGHSEWHEAVEFPDKFRINFGNEEEGNFVVFRNDSAFNYKGSNLKKARVDSNNLLLLIGGMYYRPIEDVLMRLKKTKYDLDVLSSQKWNNEDVWVVGATENSPSANQVWIDKKTFRVLRIIEKLNEKDVMDMRFEAYQNWCKGFVETKVSFRRNGSLEQEEEYYNLKETTGFPNDKAGK